MESSPFVPSLSLLLIQLLFNSTSDCSNRFCSGCESITRFEYLTDFTGDILILFSKSIVEKSRFTLVLLTVCLLFKPKNPFLVFVCSALFDLSMHSFSGIGRNSQLNCALFDILVSFLRNELLELVLNGAFCLGFLISILF